MSDFPEGGIPEANGIPVDLEVEAVKQYVMGETLTPYRFDLLQNYFVGRVIERFKNERCECLDMPVKEFIDWIQAEADKLKHANCFYVGIDWAIDWAKEELVGNTEKLESK